MFNYPELLFPSGSLVYIFRYLIQPNDDDDTIEQFYNLHNFNFIGEFVSRNDGNMIVWSLAVVVE